MRGLPFGLAGLFRLSNYADESFVSVSDGYYDSLGFYRPSTHRRTEQLAMTSRLVMCELAPQHGPVVDTTPESKRAKRRRIARARRAVR